MRHLAAAVLVFGAAQSAIAAPAAEPAAAEPTVFAHPATPAQVIELLGPAATRLKTAAGLHGLFTQRKRLKELPQPLVSSGDFTVARGQGVAWHTRKPFDSELVLTPQALIQRNGSGKATRIDAAQQPGLKAVSQVFDALFALDVDALAKTFSLSGQRGADGAAAGWVLGLVPREPALAQRIARIVVEGADQPRRITLIEAGGDQTEIAFSDTRVLDALSDAERQTFVP